MRAFKIAIIILGRPGSGKDTQAELLAKKFGLVHIISSKLIEDALKTPDKTIKLDSKIYGVQKERENLHNGKLTTFTFVSALISNEIRSIFKKNKGIIMSGSPRSKTEFEKEWPLFKKLYGDKNTFIF